MYNGIARLIAEGELEPGEKLPAVREVAKQFGINPNTVQKAYAQLEQANLICSIPAKGSYVSDEATAADALKREALCRVEKEIRFAYRAGASPEEILSLTENILNKERNGDTND